MIKDNIAENWAKRGFGCDIWTDPPGKVWKDYVHETDELVMLIEGEVEFTFNGKTFHPQPGEELLIPAGAKHTVKNIGPTRNRWYYGYKNR
jgi:quercetin dioxygenase-like cupin family protein